MPRVYTSASDPIDFCRNCFPKTEDEALQEYGDVGNGDDGRGNCFSYDEDHPPYETTDYSCEICHKELTIFDNSIKHYDGTPHYRIPRAG